MGPNPPCDVIQKLKLLHRRKVKCVAMTNVSLHFNQLWLSSCLIWAKYWPACRVPEWLMVAFKLNSLNRHTCLSLFLSKNLPLCYFLLQSPWNYYNTVAEELICHNNFGLSYIVHKSVGRPFIVSCQTFRSKKCLKTMK